LLLQEAKDLLEEAWQHKFKDTTAAEKAFAPLDVKKTTTSFLDRAEKYHILDKVHRIFDVSASCAACFS